MLRFDTHRINGILKGNNNLNFWTNSINANGGGEPPIYIKELSKTLIPFNFSSAGFDLIDYKIYGNSKQGDLPDGYTQLSNIENHSEQYIDTGIKINYNKDFKIKMSFSIPAGGKRYCLLSSYPGADTHTSIEIQTNDYLRVYINRMDRINLYPININSKNDVVIEHNATTGAITATVNNVEKTYSTEKITTVDSANALLFVDQAFRYDTFMKNIKLYNFEFIEEGVTKATYIPCKEVATSKVGMYDAATGTFKTTPTTATFTAGTTLPTPQAPLEVVSVGKKTRNLIPDFGNAYYKYSDGLGERNELGSTNYRGTTKKWTVKPNETYTLSVSNNVLTNPWLFFTMWEENGKFVGSRSGYTNSLVFVNDYSYNIVISVGVWFKDGGFQPLSDFGNLQLEQGDTASDYEPYGYKIPVKISGKNLFDYDKLTNGYYNDDGIFTESSTAVKTDFIATYGNTNYTFSGNLKRAGGNTRIHAFDKNKQWISMLAKRPETGQREIKIITPPQCSYIVVSGYLSNTDAENIQLEKGISATSYEPYKDPIETEIFLEEPLRKMGNYSDYIDFENKKVVRNIGKIKLLSDVQFAMANGCYRTISTYPTDVIDTNYALSNTFKYNPVHASITTNLQNFEFGWNVTKQLCIKDENLSSDTLWNDFILNNNVEIYYVKRPKEEIIELPAIETDEGVVSLDVLTEIKPSKVYIKYYSKDKDGTVKMEID